MTVRQGTFATLLAVLACAVAMAAATAPPAHAARGMELALQDDAVLLQRLYYSRERALTQIRALGVTRLRVNLYWAQALPVWQQNVTRKPAAVDYRWERYDELVAAAAAHGLRVQLTLSGPAPAWATGDHRRGVYRPRADYYAQFVRAVALHFRGRVDRYSIWNEPNHVGWLRPLPSGPSIYRKLFVAGYPAIKSVDPWAQVLIGETSPYWDHKRATAPIRFLRGVACVDSRWRRHCGHGLEADGYAHHPYEFLHPPGFRYPGADNATMGTLGHLTGALDRLRRSGALRTPYGAKMPLYLTEYGYFGSGRRKISAARRAAYLRQSVKLARGNKRVRQLLQYQLVQPPKRYTTFDTSLIGRNGRLTSAYSALLRAVR